MRGGRGVKGAVKIMGLWSVKVFSNIVPDFQSHKEGQSIGGIEN